MPSLWELVLQAFLATDHRTGEVVPGEGDVILAASELDPSSWICQRVFAIENAGVSQAFLHEIYYMDDFLPLP